MKNVWQLPVIQSDLSDTDWIHPKAKFHYFIDGSSLCGKHTQDTDYFETSLEDTDLKLSEEIACHKCFKLYKSSYSFI
ncbi:MAG: hypothetical protein JEZ08_16785 [Clostridiales bacterium]|nr:hypothetical protein [Clostridiales bacterium]